MAETQNTTPMFKIKTGTIVAAIEATIEISKLTNEAVCFEFGTAHIIVDKDTVVEKAEDAYKLYTEGYMQGNINAAGKKEG
ncbi:MAG: hypothetical protein OSB62_06700 [Alphaproteobacteria bacterium]|nr:hypothetical protein [Alphaproteobacteria bacterium]